MVPPEYLPRLVHHCGHFKAQSLCVHRLLAFRLVEGLQNWGDCRVILISNVLPFTAGRLPDKIQICLLLHAGGQG